MKKNIATIKVVKEENYEIDIDRLAEDLMYYIDDAMCEQLDGEACEDILDNEMRKLALLDAVGRVWQEQFNKELH